MILAPDLEGRKKALDKLFPLQKGDFVGIFEAMAGLPVTIRLLDPPLHEFLPQDAKGQEEVACKMGICTEAVQSKVRELHELNPMLGLRGCRLGIIFPEIYDMQVRAIIEAACEVKKRKVKVLPEIMMPLVGTYEEMKHLEMRTRSIAAEVMKNHRVRVGYSVGTMIEIPRAAIVADRIAEVAEFFSYGTNDLTQMTYGFSRDDAGTFLPGYIQKGILPKDPFQTIDKEGVGQLVELGIKRGRKTRPTLKVGICGEHGGDPESVIFCHNVGMDYVSCSPFRVPIARLAAAQAVALEKGAKRESGKGE
jgi:pyruvate,orthophosphate dikinase